MFHTTVFLMLAIGAAINVADVADVVPEEFTMVSVSNDCKLVVGNCFNRVHHVDTPSWKKPVSLFSEGYRKMCSPEVKVKVAKKAAKVEAEKKHKELCKKSEANGKLQKKQLHLLLKKEKYSKAISEGKQKYLAKKVKSAEEMTVKTAGKGKEFADKAAEKSNKREDVLYKKECKSKEVAFKSVREGKEKVKIVYVKKIPTLSHNKDAKKMAAKKPAAKAKKVIKKVKEKKKHKTIKKHIKKSIEMQKAMPPIVKKVDKHKKEVTSKAFTEGKTKWEMRYYLKHLKHKKEKKPSRKVNAPSDRVSRLKEVLIKTKEQTKKSQLQSAELIKKSNLTGAEAVAKAAVHKKRHKKLKKKLKKLKKARSDAEEHAEKKETKSKSEIEQKLAVERVTKKLALKEIAAKKAAPVKKKKCNPVSALEKYVKKCRNTEEKFKKSKLRFHETLKEVKLKSKQRVKEVRCDTTRKACSQIQEMSSIQAAKIEALVKDHTNALKVAMAKTVRYEAAEAAKMKYNICESAASDMRYFSKKFLYGKHGIMH